VGAKLVRKTEEQLQAPLQFSLFDDFLWYVTAHGFTTVATDSGTVTVGDARGGIVALTPSDGTVADNDEVYIRSTAELFKFDRSGFVEFKLQYTEANTDDANVAFGVMNAVAANSILDDGGGPAASYSGAVFFKVDGATVWNVESSIAGTQTTTTLTTTAGGASYVTFRIEWRYINSTRVEVTFWIDGQQVLDPAQRFASPVMHVVDPTSCTEMHVFAGLKNGAATNVETLNIDYIAGGQAALA
jgi:hypothetical protein